MRPRSSPKVLTGGAIVAHDGQDPFLVISGYEAQLLKPQVRHGCEALAAIAAMHRAAGLRRQALAAAMAMRRLTVFYEQLDALTSHAEAR